MLAQAAQVDRLILGHYSSRYETTELLEQEARRYFSNTTAAKDGDRFSVPFQGRRLSPKD
jgi:ribonuclease Z